MSTLVSNATHASRVKYIDVVYSCGHTVSLKVSPSISADYVREIRREAKVCLCQVCGTSAGKRTAHARLSCYDPCQIAPLWGVGSSTASWTNVDLEKPRRYLIVLGAILEEVDRSAVRMVTWDGLAWTYEPNDTPVERFGHQVTHWMPLPEPPAAGK